MSSSVDIEIPTGGRPETPADGDRLSALRDRLVLLATSRAWFWPVLLFVGYLAQFGFRLWFVRNMSYPSVHADEDSYLVLARVLAGHPTTEMPVGVVIPGGYPLLISPALRIADNPVTAYHLVMVINAVLNALVFPLAYAGLRRLGLRRLLAYVFAAVTALLPPVIFYSQFAMSDTVLPVLVLAWLLCLHGWLSEGPAKGRYWYAVGVGASAAYAMATHDRGGVVVAITAVVLLATLVLRWAPWRTTLVGAGALGIGVLGAKLLARWLDSKFTVPPSKVGSLAIDGITNLSLLPRTLARTLGQFWYLIISTWGLGGLAIAVCLYGIFGRSLPRASRIVGAVILTLMFGIALASAAALPDDARIDNWVYARYLSVLAPALFMIGVAVLCRAGARAIAWLGLVAAGLTVVCAELVILYAGSRLHKQVFILWGMPDASFLSADWGRLEMMRTTIAAFLILFALVLLRSTGGRKVLFSLGLCLGLFAAFATATITHQVSQPHSSWRKWEATGFTKADGLRPGDNVVMEWDTEWSLRMALSYEVYQGRVWTTSLRAGDAPPAAADVAVLPLRIKGEVVDPAQTWPKRPAGWHVAAYDEAQDWVVWRKD